MYTSRDGRLRPPNTANLPEGFKNLLDREIEWAWVYYNLYSTFPMQGSYSSTHQKRIIFSNYLNAMLPDVLSQFTDQFYIDLQNNLIDLEHLEWIDKKDFRKLIWILNKLITDFAIHRFATTASLYNDFIFLIDSLRVDINYKVNFITKTKLEYPQILTDEKGTKWINKDNKNQLLWAWEYLQKFNKATNVFFKPQSNEDYYNAILASLDAMSYEYASDKKLFIDRMKRTWSQKKFRDSGKAKKLYHIPLSKSTQSNLEKLAELKNKRKEQVIEELIIKEYEAIDLDEKGRKIY